MADGDFNLATIWASVVPETSKVGPAMEDAGKEGKRRFGEGIKDLGHTITDDLEKAGSKVKDTFSGVGSSIKDIFSRAGKEGSDSLTDSFSKAGSDAASSLTSKLSAQAGPLGGIADDLGKQFGGKLGGAIGDALKNIPGVSDLTDKFADAKTQVSGLADIIKDLPGPLGLVGDALGKWAPLIAGAITAADGLRHAVEHIFPGEHDREYDENGVPRNAAERWLDRLPGIGPVVRGLTGDKLPPGPDVSLAPVPWTDTTGLGGAGSGSGAAPGIIGGAGGDLASPGSPPVGAGDGFDSLFSGGSGIGGAGGTDWDALAGAESSGNWHNPDTGHTGHYGGLQFDQQTWNDFGGQDFAPRPDLATEDQQKTVAGRVPANQRPQRWAQTWWTQKGGTGGRGSSAGSSAASLPDVRGAHPQLAYALGAAKGMFPDLTLTAGKDDHPMDQGWHPRGQAIDIGGGTPQEQAQFSNWLLQFAPEIEELIHSGPGVTQNIKSGKIGPAIDMPGSVYSTGQAGYHGDHVHLAVTDQMASMFEAAISGRGASTGGDRGAVGPTGEQHDPLYVTQSNAGVGAGSADQAMGSQLGSGLVNGVLQEFGLDGSVFKSFGGSSNPLQFGITKLATGLINSFAGMFGGKGGGDGAALSFGGGGGIPGMAALGGLLPHPAATGVPIGPGGAQNVPTGDTHIYNAPATQFNVTQHGVDDGTQNWQFAMNGVGTGLGAASTRYGGAGGVPNGGTLPTPPGG